MAVDWNMVIALGSFGQFVVVSVAALFALWQVRHMRRQSELEASLSLLAWARSAEYRDAYPHVIGAAAAGSDVRVALENGDETDPRVLKVLSFAHFLNEIGILVEQDLIKGSTVVPYYREAIEVTWSLVVPCVARRRREDSGSSFFAPLEALVLRAKAVSGGDRFSRIRRSLPPSLRPSFDRSRTLTGAYQAGNPPSLPQESASTRKGLAAGTQEFSTKRPSPGC
jgi:hypothetical protein